MYLRFRDFIEQEELNNPTLKVKEEYAKLMNDIMQKLESNLSINELQSMLLRFKNDLSNINDSLYNLIDDKSTQLRYDRLYDNVMKNLSAFKDIPVDSTELINSLKDSLNSLHVYVQSKIRL